MTTRAANVLDIYDKLRPTGTLVVAHVAEVLPG